MCSRFIEQSRRHRGRIKHRRLKVLLLLLLFSRWILIEEHRGHRSQQWIRGTIGRTRSTAQTAIQRHRVEIRRIRRRRISAGRKMCRIRRPFVMIGHIDTQTMLQLHLIRQVHRHENRHPRLRWVRRGTPLVTRRRITFQRWRIHHAWIDGRHQRWIRTKTRRAKIERTSSPSSSSNEDRLTVEREDCSDTLRSVDVVGVMNVLRRIVNWRPLNERVKSIIHRAAKPRVLQHGLSFR
jgi:hypothetical protein